MQVDEIGAVRRVAELRADGLLRRAPRGVVDERTGGMRHRMENARDDGSVERHDARAMPGGDQRAVDQAEHLFRAAGRVGSDRRERVGDVDDGQHVDAARPLMADTHTAQSGAVRPHL